MKRVLVLGGYGFLGRHLQHELRDHAGFECFYESRRTGFDLINYESTLNKLKTIQPDIIIHAAAHVGSIAYVVKNCADVAFDNTAMYLTLYKAVAQLNREILIINPISNCSYPGIIDIQNEEYWWDGVIHSSVEAYGNPKKMGYILSECYRKQYGVNTINLIMANAYGPLDYLDEERTHAMNGIILRMIRAMKNHDKKFVVWGTGSPIREWLFMPDMARLIKLILESPEKKLPNPINIGQEFGISIIDTVNTVAKFLNFEGEIVLDTSKQDGAPIKILGSKLFQQHFPGFKFTRYEDGILETISYYRKNILQA